MWNVSVAITVLVAGLAIAGCARKDSAARSEDGQPMDRSTAGQGKGGEPASPRPQTFTGTLQSGIVAVGGETTGWILAADGAAGGLEVDVSKVQDDADRLNGQRVKIHGRMTERDWPERGKTHVLVADRIEPADPQR